MDPDFTALASRVAARAEVLGCVILSRDGLVLGAFPPHGEQDITPGLLRFASLGDPDRGFAQFPDELWAYVREGSYAAFAVADKGTRPGILLDYLEQALLVAEEARQFGQAMSEPVHVDLSQKGMRLGRRLRAATPDAPDDFRAAVVAPERTVEPAHERPPVPAVDDQALDDALAAAVGSGGDQGAGDLPDDPFAGPGGDSPAMEIPPEVGEVTAELIARSAPPQSEPAPELRAEPWAEPAAPQEWGQTPEAPPPPPGPEHEHEAPAAQPPPTAASPDEIDRIALAREFAQLLQEGPGGAESGP